MIKQIFSPEEIDFDRFGRNCYSRIMKSHYLAYGTKYDFCRFFSLSADCGQALICMFNSAMIVSANFESLDDGFLSDILTFVNMNKPERIEAERLISEKMCGLFPDEYSAKNRTEFVLEGNFPQAEIEVNESPKLDDVFGILSECHPEMKGTYELWLTDSSHRVRHGLSSFFMLNNSTTASIQYIIDGIALVGQVATLPEHRGKHYARELLFYIADKLSEKGTTLHLFARDNRCGFYEEIGFKKIFSDIILERKLIDE